MYFSSRFLLFLAAATLLTFFLRCFLFNRFFFFILNFAGRPKELIKSLSLPTDRSSCDGRTAADGATTHNGQGVSNDYKHHHQQTQQNHHAGQQQHRTNSFVKCDADNDTALRAAEQFCDSQNGK